MSGAMTLIPLYASMAWRDDLTFTFKCYRYLCLLGPDLGYIWGRGFAELVRRFKRSAVPNILRGC